MNSKSSPRHLMRGSRFIKVMWCVALGACVVTGCGWDGLTRSVRFNLSMTDRDRQRLPPAPFNAGGAKKKGDPSPDTKGADAEAPANQQAEINDLWKQAEEATTRGSLDKTKKFLRDYLHRTANSCRDANWYQPDDCQLRRNSAFDQLDALAALDQGSSAATVRAYLEARQTHDGWLTTWAGRAHDAQNFDGAQRPLIENAAETPEGEDSTPLSATDVQRALDAMPPDKNLADNAAYLRAATLYQDRKNDEAAAAFAALMAKYPRSEKREAALFMSARLRMMESGSFHVDDAAAISRQPCAACRDEAWIGAHETFARLIREYPRGRYATDARGWLAYLALRVGDVPGAVIEYYRLLSDENNPAGQAEAVISLQLSRELADEVDLERVEAILSDEPKVALSYAYYNIYNYTISDYLVSSKLASLNSFSERDDPAYRPWEVEERENIRAAAERRELKRIVSFATRLMQGESRAEVSGAFTLRVAQANLELGNDQAALELARRALTLGMKDGARAQCLWVKGVAEYRLRDYAAARATLASLVKEFSDGELMEGARRLLAMIAEDAGDLEAALEQYLALNYRADVAYFVDVLMTPDQLASFVKRHQGNREWHDELCYALGVRYMRAGRWPEARAALSHVRARIKAEETDYFHDNVSANTRRDPKNSFPVVDYFRREPHQRGVFGAWIMQDMKTIADLERLERAVGTAQGDEAQAEALYQLASYIYEGSELLFYNAAAWRGIRILALSELNESYYRAPHEAHTLWTSMQEHESLARALVIYLDLWRRFPETRAARDAFYTAAVCHERLANYNDYWRGIYHMGLHAGERLVTYADVRRIYPRYPLPLGTFGWEPATRTVNGQPAWGQPPPPAPQRTRVELLRRRIERGGKRIGRVWEVLLWPAWEWFGSIREGGVRHLVAFALMGCSVCFIYRRTRRTRRWWWAPLARGPAAPPKPDTHEAPALFSTFAAHEKNPWSARLRRLGNQWRRDGWSCARLAGRGRAALVLNIVTHGLLTALGWMLAWTFRK